MQTIRLSPGEELRVVCGGPPGNKGNNKGNNKNMKANNRRANLNYNNSNANNMNANNADNDDSNNIEMPSETNNNNNNNITVDNDDELENINNVFSGGKRGRKTRKGPKKGRKGTQKGGKKRGPNGYMKFAAEMRPKILKENPELRSNVVSVARKIGEAWRKMPEAERKKY